MIFIVTLLGAAAWNTYRVFLAGEYQDSKLVHIILIVYQVLLAMIISLSMKGHPGVLFYFGFLRGKLAKALFFLFCATLVFPFNTDADPSTASDWIN